MSQTEPSEGFNLQKVLSMKLAGTFQNPAGFVLGFFPEKNHLTEGQTADIFCFMVRAF